MTEDKNQPGGGCELPINDYLAVRRTRMSNERTLLSFLRTFLGLVTAGVAMIQILTQLWVHILGYIFLGLGPILLVVGLVAVFPHPADDKRAGVPR